MYLVVARMAYDPCHDQDLVQLNAGHLFAMNTTKIGFRRGTFLRGYMYDFIEIFSSHLTRERVREAERTSSPEEVAIIFDSLELPLR